MNLTDLRETAGLARLALNEEELEKVFPAFKETLAFFSVLPETGGEVSPEGIHIKTVTPGSLRPDTEYSQQEKNFCEAILAQAPERDGRFMVIPNVL